MLMLITVCLLVNLQKQKQLDKKQATIDQLSTKLDQLQEESSAQVQKGLTSSLHKELITTVPKKDAQTNSKRWESKAQALQQQLEKVIAHRLALSIPLLTGSLQISPVAAKGLDIQSAQ